MKFKVYFEVTAITTNSIEIDATNASLAKSKVKKLLKEDSYITNPSLIYESVKYSEPTILSVSEDTDEEDNDIEENNNDEYNY